MGYHICKGICNRVQDITNLYTHKYNIGIDGLKCNSCSIVYPISSEFIRIFPSGKKYCSCCGRQLSGRQTRNNFKRHRQKLELVGLIKRY